MEKTHKFENEAEHIQKINDVTNGRRHLVYGYMLYGCSKCRYVEPIFLGVGVEGPQELRLQGLYIPCPFMGPPCWKCGGETAHVMYGSDRELPGAIPAPAGMRFWRIPELGIRREYFGSIAFCGDLAVG